MNFKIVSYFLGWVLKIEAAAMVVPCVIAMAYGEADVWPWFLACIAFDAAVGFLMSNKKFKDGNFFVREGYVSTALGWILLSLVGAFPFFLSGRIPKYIDALFEIASGFTTTGSSILADVEAMGYGLNMWRCLSHWLGGMGVLVLILAILPMNGGYHMQMMKAESPGPAVSKLVPRVGETAKMLYGIYFVLTVICILCYLISGMPVFDAFCMGFGTAGTGGFAIRNSGLADYSGLSQSFITLFMILFGINFNVYFLLVRKDWKSALKCEEMRYFLSIVAAAIIILTLITFKSNYSGEGFYYAFHHSAFTVGSLISSTGYSTVDFNVWPEFAKMILLLLMFCGACAGSTGGGFKVSRIVIIMKEAFRELHMLIHPHSVKLVKFEGKPVEHSVIRSLNNYLIIYVFIFLISILLLSIDGFDFTTNFSATLATIDNIGPGLNAVGPTSNFAAYSWHSKIVLIFNMIAGRLELIPILMLFYKNTWKKHF